MRNSSCMNDFMEVEHGLSLLIDSYKSARERLSSVFDAIFPGFLKELENSFNDWIPHFRRDTYITCFSEHDDEEDYTGRLSMWRAYGGKAGIAIVMKGDPFLRVSHALKAYTNPVSYLDKEQFYANLQLLIQFAEENAPLLKQVGQAAVHSHMFHFFRTSVLCTKHPGFKEEREWRVIYSPKFEQSSRITTAPHTVNGIPQKICRIPLKNVPEEGLYGIEVHELVDRLIIGPTEYPEAMREAFVAALSEAGIEDAADRVIISDIPLRQ